MSLNSQVSTLCSQLFAMTKLLCVYCSSSDRIDAKYFAAAEALGAEIVARGWGLVYGGGKTGLMGAVARAVKTTRVASRKESSTVACMAGGRSAAKKRFTVLLSCT